MKRRTSPRRGVGAEVIAGLEEAVAFERGQLRDVKITRATLSSQGAEVTPAPAYKANRISSLRERLNLSQPVFAAALNVSSETIKKWEQGTREPDGAALRLLELAEAHPQWIVETLASSESDDTSAKPAKGAYRRRARNRAP